MTAEGGERGVVSDVSLTVDRRVCQTSRDVDEAERSQFCWTRAENFEKSPKIQRGVCNHQFCSL